MTRLKIRDLQERKTLSEGFNDFIKYCRVKNLVDKSITYYEECYGFFEKFYGQDNYISKITTKTIDDYILWLKSNYNINDISLNTRLRGIRTMMYYFMSLGYLQDFKIKLVKAEKKIKEIYTDDELILLLKKPDLKTCSFTDYRNWVLVNYLLGTGNRANSIVNIKIKDLDLENQLMKLTTTKNRYQQMIPLPSSLCKILLEYLQYREYKDDEEYLFCNHSGNKLTVNAIKLAIKSYNMRRGVMKTSIHLFRNTFATKYLINGGDILRLQKLLGHKTLQMVREYINLLADDLKKNYDRVNPLEQLTTENNERIKMKRKKRK